MADSQGKSFVEFNSDGSTTAHGFSFPYLDRDHVGVLVDGVVTAFTFLSDNVIELTPAPAVDTVIRIKRETPNEALVDFNQGNQFSKTKLLTGYLQILYVAQEAFDEGTTIQVDASAAFDEIVEFIGTTADELDAEIAALQEFPPGLSALLAQLQADLGIEEAAITAVEADVTALDGRLTALESFTLPTPTVDDLGFYVDEPILSTPTDESEDNLKQLTLTIDTPVLVPGLIHHSTTFEVATDEAFTDIVQTSIVEAPGLATTFEGSYGDSYYWRASIQAILPSDPSAPFLFTIEETVVVDWSLWDGAGISYASSNAYNADNPQRVNYLLQSPFTDLQSSTIYRLNGGPPVYQMINRTYTAGGSSSEEVPTVTLVENVSFLWLRPDLIVGYVRSAASVSCHYLNVDPTTLALLNQSSQTIAYASAGGATPTHNCLAVRLEDDAFLLTGISGVASERGSMVIEVSGASSSPTGSIAHYLPNNTTGCEFSQACLVAPNVILEIGDGDGTDTKMRVVNYDPVTKQLSTVHNVQTVLGIPHGVEDGGSGIRTVAPVSMGNSDCMFISTLGQTHSDVIFLEVVNDVVVVNQIHTPTFDIKIKPVLMVNKEQEQYIFAHPFLGGASGNGYLMTFPASDLSPAGATTIPMLTPYIEGLSSTHYCPYSIWMGGETKATIYSTFNDNVGPNGTVSSSINF